MPLPSPLVAPERSPDIADIACGIELTVSVSTVISFEEPSFPPRVFEGANEAVDPRRFGV